jgi:hypothetical protein
MTRPPKALRPWQLELQAMLRPAEEFGTIEGLEIHYDRTGVEWSFKQRRGDITRNIRIVLELGG